MTKLKLTGNWPEWMDQTEARIINRLITAILARGLKVRVWDGEEWATDLTDDRATIQKETHATEATVFVVYRDTRFMEGVEVQPQPWQRIGAFVLIHGNGEDVISDYSWDETLDGIETLMEDIFKEAVPE